MKERTEDDDHKTSGGSTSVAYTLILGGSQGLGLATAKKLAQSGSNLIIVHRDRRADMPSIKAAFAEIEAFGNRFMSYNMDATKAESRRKLLMDIKRKLSEKEKIKVLVHSIAKGTVKPMHSKNNGDLSNRDFHLTIDAMAISLYDWAKGLVDFKLFAEDARIVSFTSEGNNKAIPNYGAVSAAKSVLESITRNLAVELAPLGIKANCIQAGVTDTASFRRIPNSTAIKKHALARNPSGRLTQAEDIANVVYLLCREEAKWITGSVIKVDGGESLR